MNVSHYKYESYLILLLLPLGLVGVATNDFYLSVGGFGMLWLLQMNHSIVLFFNYWKDLVIRTQLIFYGLGVTAFYLLRSGNKINSSDSFLEKLAKLTFFLILIFYLWFITRHISKNPPDSESQ